MNIIFLLIMVLIILFLPLPIVFEASYDKQFKVYLYKKFKIPLKNNSLKKTKIKKKYNNLIKGLLC